MLFIYAYHVNVMLHVGNRTTSVHAPTLLGRSISLRLFTLQLVSWSVPVRTQWGPDVGPDVIRTYPALPTLPEHVPQSSSCSVVKDSMCLSCDDTIPILPGDHPHDGQ